MDKRERKIFSSTFLNGLLGISAEIALTAGFIAIGALVCLLWWGIFK